MSKLKLAVVFGGASSEHSVSLVSATSVLNNLDKSKYDIIPVGITKKGRWLFYPGSYEEIESGAWEKYPDNVPCFISPDSTTKGLVKILSDQTIS
ncbi:MAG: D-alanine--D-alanine ligase, partial [Oscillospiraceae bacterium]